MMQYLVSETIGDFFNTKFYTVNIYFFKNQKMKIEVWVLKTGTSLLSLPPLTYLLTGQITYHLRAFLSLSGKGKNQMK